MKKLIQDKNTILKDMLDGITVSNNDVEVVSDTIVVRKHKNNQVLHSFLGAAVDMNLHTQDL